MAMVDFWDQQVLTRFVRQNIEEESQNIIGGDQQQAPYGATIAPLVAVQDDMVKIRVSDVLPYGLGQFKAPDATPPLFKPKPTLRETIIELALLDEMERFKSTDWRMLTSSDPKIAAGAMLSLADRLRIMQLRNENLTNWMRWQSFKGTLPITYPDGGTITIDYGMQVSHFPTAGTPWTTLATSDPIEDLNAWGQIGADDIGAWYTNVHMNSYTWRLIERNQTLGGYLSQLGRSIMLPTQEDMNRLLRDRGTKFHIVDEGYLPDNAVNHALTKFIPNNRVLMTTEYVLRGQRIADVADGMVAVNVPGSTAPVFRQGAQSELISNPFSKNVFRRQASARMPRIYLPDAFLYATVGA